jgi:hypothetical protein
MSVPPIVTRPQCASLYDGFAIPDLGASGQAQPLSPCAVECAVSSHGEHTFHARVARPARLAAAHIQGAAAASVSSAEVRQ